MEESEPRGFRFEIVVAILTIVMVVLAASLYVRIQQVDPVRRCADAYESSYTAVDTTLVDRMKVKKRDGRGRTTCAAVRASGAIDSLPRRQIRRPGG
jgi:hypothetical protein